jgi:transposase
MAYSVDYRKRAMELLAEGKSQTEVSELLGVNRKTLYEWKKREGDLATRYPASRGAYHISEEAIRAHLKEKPDAYLSEIAAVAGGTAQGVRDALKRMGITRKKRHSSTKNETKRNDKVT